MEEVVDAAQSECATPTGSCSNVASRSMPSHPLLAHFLIDVQERLGPRMDREGGDNRLRRVRCPRTDKTPLDCLKSARTREMDNVCFDGIDAGWQFGSPSVYRETLLQRCLTGSLSQIPSKNKISPAAILIPKAIQRSLPACRPIDASICAISASALPASISASFE